MNGAIGHGTNSCVHFADGNIVASGFIDNIESVTRLIVDGKGDLAGSLFIACRIGERSWI